MQILLLLLFVALLIALVYFYNQLNDVRSELANTRETIDNSLRALDRRIGLLERASAERRMESAAPTSADLRVSIPVEANRPPSSPYNPPSIDPDTAAPQVPVPPPPLPVAPRTQSVPPLATPVSAQATITFASDGPATTSRDAIPPADPATQPAFAPGDTRQQPPAMPPPPERLSLEERLGTNWLSKLGVGLVVIGVAYYLARRFETMGPAGKALTAMVASLTLLLGGIWLQRKSAYRIFARAGIGGGWALLFFTTFAMHHFEATRIISSLLLDLLLMLLVAAGMVAYSLRYRSQTVTGLAFLLGFATLATSDLEATSGTVVFSLVASALLALGLVIVTTRWHWAWLELAGLVAVMGNHVLWLALVMTASGGVARFPLFWQSTALIFFYWIVFRAAYLLRVPVDDEEDRISSLSAVVTAGGVLGLLKLQSAHPEWAFRALLAMGTVEMLLGVWSRRRRRSAFLVLTTVGTVLLVAAVPFQFHGVSWPILWLVESHALALCGFRLGEPVFRRLGLLAGFCASLVLVFHDVLGLITFRAAHADAAHHPSLAIGLALAAALFWLHGEAYPRRWSEIYASLGEFEQLGLRITSWLGLAAAATALWVVLPSQWVAPGWLALVVILGFAADWTSAVRLALQADLLAAAAIPALLVWDFADAPAGVYRLPSALAIAGFYAGMRRRTVPGSFVGYVPTAYSWVGSLVLCLWIGEAVDEKWMIIAWAISAIALFEVGRFFNKACLRWQAFVPALLAFCGLQIRWFAVATVTRPNRGWFNLDWHDLLAVITVTALAYGLQERSRLPSASDSGQQAEQKAGVICALLGTYLAAAWLPLMVPDWGRAESASTVWAVLASILLVVAFLSQRGAFQIHAILVGLWTGLYGAFIALEPFQAGSAQPWWQTALFRLGLASAILLAGLPVVFRLRRLWTAEGKWARLPSPLALAAARPEQWFFFIPFGLMIVTLAAELREGNITLGWSLLGLGAFILALLVGQRSFRLGGLALLMLSVAKILLMDVWRMEQADKYITLIVTGCALILVSFLYARFGDLLRRYL